MASTMAFAGMSAMALQSQSARGPATVTPIRHVSPLVPPQPAL
jgi:hypothetical protein